MERHEGADPSGNRSRLSAAAGPGGTGNGPGRRRFLRGLGGGIAAVGAGLPALAGCLGAAAESVSVLAAGSLAHTFEDHVGPAFEERTGIALHGEYYGSNAVMRMVEDRTKHPDVVVSADATLLRDRLYDGFVDWDVEFATNVLGIGYNPNTDLGTGLERGEPWYDLVRGLPEGDLTIGEPDLDPLGYRAVQAFELAETEYGLDGFREEMLEQTYREPEEPQMMAGVSTGARAGAVVYGNMAVDHGMPFHEFPPAYNFAEPELADHYATAVFVTDEEGYEAVGRPILYNAAVPDDADTPDAGRQLVAFLMDRPDLLIDAGLRVPDSLPRAFGAPPGEVEP
ncbi:molybdate/tungstate transport system substrate-binding protein [Halalkaliarchaeum desulfuricum]|uniref:Molybdate/tungstate transport system substrate-binding protein n=1 Tax=Halalkaliarchaeum desulfuricum TaxID=2055893 RepID=A0A343TNS2_9EURY|nr:extracellular solute-binding protein [Halalkaliarchaeum desulfuricum]AUX10744.1 molybdate/tungstate transport system substrate-binding protein [Halalkaliarchaeum desulfuricum]